MTLAATPPEAIARRERRLAAADALAEAVRAPNLTQPEIVEVDVRWLERIDAALAAYEEARRG